MSGSKLGGIRARDTNYERQGGDFYREIGARGGAKSRGYPFGHGKVDPSVIGRLGGRISRRGQHKLTEKERREIRKAYKELLEIHNKAKRERADQGAITVFDRRRGLVLSEVA